eukprot:315977_1
MMGLMVIGLDIQLVLYHHLQLLVRIVMMIVNAFISAYTDDNSNGDFAGSVYIYENDNKGSAYIYEKDNNGSWNEVSKLLASDGESGDNFGWSVGIAPPFAFISAYTAANSNGDMAGSVYIYENDNKGSWNEVSNGSWNEVKLIASDGAADDYFGASVSIALPFALIGASLDDNSNG